MKGRLNFTMRGRLENCYSKVRAFNKGEFIQILFLIGHLLYGVGKVDECGDVGVYGIFCRISLTQQTKEWPNGLRRCD